MDHVLDGDANSKTKNVSSMARFDELSTLDDEWLATSTLWPIIDKATNSNTLFENYTCVGEPEYCNLTEAEYLEMIYDYIFPTPGEWVLIGFHTIVFFVGLVSYHLL